MRARIARARPHSSRKTASVTRPLSAPPAGEPRSRRSLLPGLLGALAYNASRRQPDVRLFEVGVVFSHPGAGKARVVERSGAGGTERAELPGERELLSAVFAGEDGDARSAVAAWHVLADALRLDGVRLVPPSDGTPPLPGLHPTRSAHLMARAGSLDEVTIGSVGEIDPAVAARFDLTRTSGGATGRISITKSIEDRSTASGFLRSCTSMSDISSRTR